MLGGYNISPLIELLDDAEVGTVAAEALKKTLLMFDLPRRQGKGRQGQRQRQGRAAKLGRRRVVHQPSGSAASLTVTVFKVPGETNTDDLSPAPDATTRPDIPLHALAMLKNARAAFSRKKTASAARSSSSSR
jgi:aconitate hydratase 2/2-methylisocitrate dehydratase